MPARRWSWAHGLALVGVPLLVWEAWTVVAWLADGPYQITQFRDRHSASWYGAAAIEGLLVMIGVVVLVYLVRGCLRARKVLTFDVMFCVCAVTMIWGDVGANVFHPVLLNSSNWVNVNNMCGHLPFVVNPDCGRVPDPIMFNVLIDLFALLGVAIVAGALVERARRRWPGISNVRLFGLLLVGGLALDLLIEPVLVIPLHLWSYAPTALSLPIGQGFRYPLVEMLGGGLFLALPVALRVFRDDRGDTLVERGLERHSPPTRRAISMLGLYGFFQLVLWLGATLPLLPLGFYEHQWHNLPNHVVNDVCDAPGVTGTRYGPCPGSPGYRMPGRHSLPGKSP